MNKTTIGTMAAILAFFATAGEASAQSSDSGPALGVARVSLVNGDVSMRRGDSGDWVAATPNMPLVEGDVLETGPGSRAEIQLDYSNLIRVDGSSSVEVAQLADRRFRIRLLRGRLNYSELRGGEADIDIETPFVAVRPRETGRYEVEARPGETVVQVRRGEAEVATPDGIRRVRKGRLLAIRDAEGALDFREGRAEPGGEWDDWNAARDERLAKSQSYNYVSRSIVGAEDLDHHGDWRYVPGYGHCWYPRVAVGWAPYRFGHWGWIDYYGWSWIGYEPWGWAPYHYGRWFHHPAWGWGWWPGYVHTRYAWQPGLVAFFGYSGRNFSLGIGFGSGFGGVGWVPLAPYEPFHPWWGWGGRGWGGRTTVVNNTTIVVDNSTNIYNTYRNARVNNGVTVVDAESFSQGRLNNAASLRGDELQRASLIRGQIPVVPDRSSQGQVLARAGTDRAVGVRTFSRDGGDARTTGARPTRGSFDEQRERIASSVRDFRTGGGDEAGGVRGGASARATPSVAAGPDDVRSTARSGFSTVRGGPADRGAPSVRGGGGDSGRGASIDGGASGVRSAPSASVRSRAAAEAPQAPSRIDRSGSTVRGGAADRDATTVRGASPARSRSGEAFPASPSRVDRGGSTVRGGERPADASTRSFPERTTSRIDVGRPTNDRDASQPLVRSRGGFPESSSSRVDRGTPARSAPDARLSPAAPERSSSRVDRSGSRAPSSPGSSVRSSPSYPQGSPSRVERGPSPRGGYGEPSMRSRGGGYSGSSSGGYGAPSRAPSAPSVRSVPSGGYGGRSSGGYSAPSGGAPSGGSYSRPSGGGAASGGGVRGGSASGRSRGGRE